jgi:hypothetical protein
MWDLWGNWCSEVGRSRFDWAGAGAVALGQGSKKALKAYQDSVDPDARRKRQLRAEMEAAPTYGEWALAATKLDQLEGHGERARATRWAREIRLYDRQLLKDRVRDLRRVRQHGKLGEMIFAVRADLLRNLGNMTNRCVITGRTLTKQCAWTSLTDADPKVAHLAECCSTLCQACHGGLIDGCNLGGWSA